MTQEGLLFVTANLRELYLGAPAVPMLTTLASTPRSGTTSDGSPWSPRTANETLDYKITKDSTLKIGWILMEPKALMDFFLLSFI